jgi:ring-1,2-phenylacetyl-CoA epoxidase subunit PaaD
MVTHAPGAAPVIAQVWRWLEEIADPEIPAISIVDLGIVRDVAWSGRTLHLTITPTYSGCPATRVIEREIARTMLERGVDDVVIEVRLAPAWTTDWLTAAGREKLRGYGISPPGLRFTAERASCPRCGSADVSETSRFGSTPCKALYRCNACREPFDHFKSH